MLSIAWNMTEETYFQDADSIISYQTRCKIHLNVFKWTHVEEFNRVATVLICPRIQGMFIPLMFRKTGCCKLKTLDRINKLRKVEIYWHKTAVWYRIIFKCPFLYSREKNRMKG